MELLQAYESESDSMDDSTSDENRIPVGGDYLENFLHSHTETKVQCLHRNRRKLRTEFVSAKVGAGKENFGFTRKVGEKVVNNSRNRFSDEFIMTAVGRERQGEVHVGISKDINVVDWMLYCPGKGNCRRQCGGFGMCKPGCNNREGRHSQHNCSVRVRAVIRLSNVAEWVVTVQGQHVPTDMEWTQPAQPRRLKIAESVKDRILSTRQFGVKPFDVVRHELANVGNDFEEIFKDTKFHPTDTRIKTFIKNTEKRHACQDGQWTAVHQLATHGLKDSGICLLYQRDSYVLVVSNQACLRQCRLNKPVIGVDGKHGLQDDGACLMTMSTQHPDGFGCPAGFAIMIRENTKTIHAALEAILLNIPCGMEDCSHPTIVEELEDGGYRRLTPCGQENPYRPFVMMDKFDPTANACVRLNLRYILCWFHIVKALMDKMKSLGLHLVASYLTILGFKLVARATSENAAQLRWSLFIEALNNLPHTSAAQSTLLVKYFQEEWWCDKWREAWLDWTRTPMISDGTRMMTTNNHDENLNLKVTDAVGGRRKKVSTLVAELTGHQAARSNDPDGVGPKPRKASLLDTHAAKLACHHLGRQDNTPRDIKLRENQSRFLYIEGKVQPCREQTGLYFVLDTTHKERRFKDHKGNWVTVSTEAASVLDTLWSELKPGNIPAPDSSCIVDLRTESCSCSDFVWRSAMRDGCAHLKACQLHFLDRHQEGRVKHLAAAALVKYIRTLTKAKPKACRIVKLIDDDDEVVLDELRRLHSLHQDKVWDVLTRSSKSAAIDPMRPTDLPRDVGPQGRPRLRAAKPRAANPFLRRRNLNKTQREPAAGITVQRKQQPKPSGLKRRRNCARRAFAAAVSPCSATKRVASALLSKAKSRTGVSPVCTRHAGIRADLPRRSLSGSNVCSTPTGTGRKSVKQRVEEIQLTSPGLTRGQILAKLAHPVFSRAGRRILKKRHAADFVTP